MNYHWFTQNIIISSRTLQNKVMITKQSNDHSDQREKRYTLSLTNEKRPVKNKLTA